METVGWVSNLITIEFFLSKLFGVQLMEKNQTINQKKDSC
jgi:hypothetical protein